MVAVCFVSNKPKNLASALDAFKTQFERETLVVIDTKETHAANKRTVEKAKAKKKIHLEQTQLQKTGCVAFGEGYGEARNAALYASAVLNEDCIFFDDDTTPENECVELFKDFFACGKKIVAGKYLGHNEHDAQSLFIELCSVLKEYADGILPKDNASASSSSIINGIGRKSTSIDLKKGLVSGCMGINSETARDYCFIPSSYHSEIPVYELLSQHYVGRNAVYNSYSSDEPPIVFHSLSEKTQGLLSQALVLEGKGMVVASCISELLSGGREAIIDKEALELSSQKAEEYWKKTCFNYVHDKNTYSDLLGAAQELGIMDEFDEFYELSPKNFVPPAKETSETIATFFQAQEQWEKTVAKAKGKIT
ncbi:MAG TPA: hypothetical protein VI875_04160 [Candidatus Norongarragalinales archaeon]|nr:hypothetical protein [Candidatus Norongarragalinales archaeon]